RLSTAGMHATDASRRPAFQSPASTPSLGSHLLFHCRGYRRDLHPFPTRRSSDLGEHAAPAAADGGPPGGRSRPAAATAASEGTADRKSTRLNSSHVKTSYAVFCLKKKTQRQTQNTRPRVPQSV